MRSIRREEGVVFLTNGDYLIGHDLDTNKPSACLSLWVDFCLGFSFKMS